MCCFSTPVADVANTNLFARALAGDRQILVYQMELRSAEPTAMILPLPVPPQPREDAVRLIDISEYPSFFIDLHKPFAAPATKTRTGGAGAASLPLLPRLAVHRVGAFEASFVPSRADFERLDPRFRLPPEAWNELPDYADWGFAVFKLRDLAAARSAVPPMAFDFPRRDPSALFFPTVHVHDGRVHPTARFDHNLFLQSVDDEAVVAIGNRARSTASSRIPAHEFTAPFKARGVLDKNLPVQVVRFAGELPNHDAVAPAPSPVTADLDIAQLVAWRQQPRPLAPARAARLVAGLCAARDAREVTPASVARSIALVEYLPSAQQDPGYAAAGSAARYGSPELFRSLPLDARTEVYEAAALLYHLVAGQPLFGDGMAALVGHVTSPPPLLGHAPLDGVLARALAKDPAQRHPSLGELAASLAAI